MVNTRVSSVLAELKNVRLRAKAQATLPLIPPEGSVTFQRNSKDNVLIIDTGADETILAPAAWQRINPESLGLTNFFGTPIEKSIRKVAELVNAESIMISPYTRQPCGILQINCAYMGHEMDDLESMLSDTHALSSGTIFARSKDLLGSCTLYNKYQNFDIQCYTDLKTKHLLVSHPDKWEGAVISKLPRYVLTTKQILPEMLDHYANCVGDKSTCVRRVLSHLSDRAPPLVWKDGQIEIWQKRFNAATKEVINETFRHTTQAYKSVQVEQRTRPRHFFKKKYPAFAFNRLREWVYSDTVFLEHDKKHPYQFFYASKSKVTYMVKLNGNMKAKTTCDALLSFFQDVGMPYGVATDGAKNEVLSKVWKKFLEDYPCETHSSEPNCQYQN